MQSYLKSTFLHGSSTVFLGKYSLVLDEMDRFLPPARFTKDLSSVFYIAQGFDHNLWVLPLNVFEAIYRRIGSLNLTDPLARMLLRMILSTAQEIQANQDGTIAIPKELKEVAKINQTILAIGQGDYFEIWEPASWDKQEIQLKDTITNTNRFSSLSIIAR